MAKIILNNLVDLQNETSAVTTLNTNNAALTTALTKAVFRDGSAPNQMDADFDMNSHRILNLPAPIFANDVVRLQDTTTLIAGLIPAHSITNPKLAQAPAFTVKGNNTSGTGDVTDITVSQLQSMTNEGLILAGTKLAVNMNSTADQAITVSMPDHYRIFKILVTNPSVSLTTAVGGFYTAVSKGGVQIIVNSQVYSTLTTNTMNVAGNMLELTPPTGTPRLNLSTIYLSLTTPQGAPATADVYVYAMPLYSANLNPSNPNTLPTRIRLSGLTDFYITTSGSDLNPGTIALPWATLQHAYDYLQANYDLSGQQVIVHVADGTYLGITGNGPIVGQGAAYTLRFQGNVTTPANCVIADPNSYGFGASFGAKYAITGFKVDMTNGRQDMITSTSSGEIWIINPNPGTPANVFIFGAGCGLGFNDMSVAFNGLIFIDTWVKYTIDDTANNVNTTGTWISGSGQMVVASATGLKIGMVVRGAGVHLNTIIVNIVGTTITLNGVGTFASGTGTPVSFVMGRQCHADVGVRGAIIHNTNGSPGYNAIDILGLPFYYGGFILSNGSGAQASFQTVAITGNCTGPKFVVKTLGSIDTAAGINNPATYLPGDVVTKTSTFAADVADITISSNGNNPYYGTEVHAGQMVIASQFRSPSDPNFQTATAEATTVLMSKGTYSLGSPSDLRLTLPSIAAGSAATLTFVGLVGTGGQYN